MNAVLELRSQHYDRLRPCDDPLPTVGRWDWRCCLFVGALIL